MSYDKYASYKLYPYDIETYANTFTMVMCDQDGKNIQQYTCSPWHNDWDKLMNHLDMLEKNKREMVGFNNIGFDWPVLDYLMKFPNATGLERAHLAKRRATQIIEHQNKVRQFGGDRFKFQISPFKQKVRQLDLQRINHFDNIAKMVSLKELAFNRRTKSLMLMPYHHTMELDRDQIEELLDYNRHDVHETVGLLEDTMEAINYRRTLVKEFGPTILNASDPSIGTRFFTKRLREAGVKLHEINGDGKTKPLQTKRGAIKLSDAIMPYTSFQRPELQRLHKWLHDYTIHGTKEVFTQLPIEVMEPLADIANMKTKKVKGVPGVEKLNIILDGLQYDIGTGGLHSSVHNQTFVSNDEWVIKDIDVVSFYTSVALSNSLHPEHLGMDFCKVYRELKDERLTYPKSNPINGTLKLALNGVYGKSNDKFSVFYDPLYTMSITINGQLVLLKLVDMISTVPSLQVIQSNTDGITVYVKRKHYGLFKGVCKLWEDLMDLELEYVEYSHMWIANVNNYLCQYQDGGKTKRKRKGYYEYNIGLHQNHSALVVPKITEQFLMHGGKKSIRELLEAHEDIWDFFLRLKVNGNSGAYTVDADGHEYEQQKICRYMVVKNGDRLMKWMPPLPKKVKEAEDNFLEPPPRRQFMQLKTDSKMTKANLDMFHKRYHLDTPQFKVRVYDDVVNERLPKDIDYDFYEVEVRKLIRGVGVEPCVSQ